MVKTSLWYERRELNTMLADLYTLLVYLGYCLTDLDWYNNIVNHLPSNYQHSVMILGKIVVSAMLFLRPANSQF